MSGAALRFWGVRGSIPCPGPATVRYGGNTACVTLDAPGAHTLVLDAGTGLRALGLALQRRSEPIVLDLLLSHTHWDHIQGLPFFFPLYAEGARVRILGPRQAGGLRGVLERQMTWETFPIPPSAQVGLTEVVDVESGPIAVDGWSVHAFRLCHPGHTLGYRVERPGVAPLAYVTDNELAGGVHQPDPAWRDGLVDFLQGVHTLVHDTTWAEDRLPAVAGWGHSSPLQAITLARDAGVQRVILFHHDPDQDDTAMDRHLAAARTGAARLAPGLSVVAAVEGEAMRLEPTP